MKRYVPPDLVTLSTYDQVHRAFALLGTKSGTKFGTMFRFTYLSYIMQIDISFLISIDMFDLFK